MRPQDETLLVAFDSKVELQRMLRQPQQAAALLPELSGGGPTALYDALYLVCQHPVFSESGVPRRSALILFSDGDDNLSTPWARSSHCWGGIAWHCRVYDLDEPQTWGGFRARCVAQIGRINRWACFYGEAGWRNAGRS